MIREERDQLIRLEQRVEHMAEAMDRMELALTDLSAQANRWKGGLFVIMALGGLIGSVATWALRKFGA